MIEKIFKSTVTSAKIPTQTLHVNFWKDIPQLEIWTEDSGGNRIKIGPSVVFRNPELLTFIQWILSEVTRG